MSYVTPWSGELEEGVYEIEFPTSVLVGEDEYLFQQWENGDINPIRTITLNGDIAISATYVPEGVPPTSQAGLPVLIIGGLLAYFLTES
jgi:hypothetical protein